MDTKYQFDVECSLGKGSFAEVLKVVSKGDQKAYALKLIELQGKHITFETVMREINFMSTIDHPNIVKFIDAFKTNENETSFKFGIQMEYCAQGDMDSLIKQRNGRKFRSQTMQKWMLEISSAIGYVHAKGIMHRDLKPGNVFLDEFSNIKIGDFGIAKDVLNSVAGTKIGTSMFMAPETFTGRYYIEADVYSMGCVFICMAAASRYPKTVTGGFVPLPPVITYGKTKMDLFRRCVDHRKEERPTAAQVFRELQTDTYEMLCFHEVRSKNINFSVNKMVAGRKTGELDSAFVFSNRGLERGEKFCLILQKIREDRLSGVPFGFTTTDPEHLKQRIPLTLRELNQCKDIFLQKAEMHLEQNKCFSFWYEANGAVMYQYDGKQYQCLQNVPVSTKLWAFFNIYQDILQVQLTDYGS